MLIGLDGIPLTELRTGVGHYTAELARALALLSPDARFDLLCPSTAPAHEGPAGRSSENPSRPPPNLRAVRVPVGALGRHWWSVGLPRYLRSAARYDLFHGTNFDVPLWGGCPSVLTVHDLSTYLHAATHTRRAVLRARRRMPLMARAAAAVITPTEAVRREVCERLRVAPSKVFAVPEAPRAVFRPVEHEEADAVRRALGVGPDFLLAVGTIEPRKNLDTLVRAFAELARGGDFGGDGGGSGGLQLVVAGRRGWLGEELAGEVRRSGVSHRVVFTGYVTDEQLRALYGSCRAFAYPSLYEGFGLPPLEAMACGAAVVCGRTAALAETAGPAALLVEPRDARALASALASLLGDADARRRLSEAGRARAAEFTWERAARMTLEVYREALGRAAKGARS